MTPEATERYRLRRSSHDFYARGLIGPVFYLVAYLLLLAVSEHAAPWSGWLVLPVLFFGALWFARYRHRPPADDAAPEAFRKFDREHWLLVHTSSVGWGLIPAMVGWLERKPDSAILVSSLATMAFCTAASQAFAMHPRQARLSILALMLPGVAVFLVPSFDLRSTGITLFFYGFYLLANLRRSAAEYSSQLDTEVELLQSRAEVALLSLTDSLTGLANRRNYELRWQQASSIAARQAVPLALLVLDLDHFKRVNDRHGHLAGDACLKHFADVLRKHVRREGDFIARLGGEEFVVVLPGTTRAESLEFSETLRAAVAEAPCHFEGSDIPLTVSVGVDVVDPSSTPGLTFKRADAACYAAKEAGRNRVIAWSTALETRTAARAPLT